MCMDLINKTLRSAERAYWNEVDRAERLFRDRLEGLVIPGLRVRIVHDPYHVEGLPGTPPSVVGTEGVTASGVNIESDMSGGFFTTVMVRDNISEREYQIHFLEFV